MRSFAASAITRLPAASTATAQVFTEVPAARPPSRNGPLAAVPTGVVSLPDAGSMLRTVQLSAAISCPLPNATPQGELLVPAICVDTPRFTLVPAAGPPTPPATVEIVPSGAAPLAARGAPEAPALAPPVRGAAALAAAPASTVMLTATAADARIAVLAGPPARTRARRSWPMECSPGRLCGGKPCCPERECPARGGAQAGAPKTASLAEGADYLVFG